MGSLPSLAPGSDSRPIAPSGYSTHAGSGGEAGPLDAASLWKLATWLSPAYPVGTFAYSHGLEWAIAAGDLPDAESASAWIADCIGHGTGRNDAILLANAWRAEAAGDTAALTAIAELAVALAPSAERLLETEAQGAAFAEVTGAIWPETAADPYPVAVGRAAARQRIPLPPTVLLFLHAIAANLVSASVRLVPIGQTEGQRALAGLMPLCQRVAEEALTAELEETGGCAFRSDIAAMRHETQAVRLFRT